MEKASKAPARRILIVDDHWVVRWGVRHLLKAQKRYYDSAVEEAEDGKQAVEKVAQMDFDLVLLDYRMPVMGGVEAAREILALRPRSRILAFSIYNEPSHVNDMKEAGANGYILKSIGEHEFLTAIETVMEGRSYYSNEVYKELLKEEQNKWQRRSISKREREVLRLIAQGMTSAEIAKLLSLEKATINSHRNHLLSKFEVRNTAALLRAAYEQGLLH